MCFREKMYLILTLQRGRESTEKLLEDFDDARIEREE